MALLERILHLLLLPLLPGFFRVFQLPHLKRMLLYCNRKNYLDIIATQTQYDMLLLIMYYLTLQTEKLCGDGVEAGGFGDAEDDAGVALGGGVAAHGFDVPDDLGDIGDADEGSGEVLEGVRDIC